MDRYPLCEAFGLPLVKEPQTSAKEGQGRCGLMLFRLEGCSRARFIVILEEAR